MNATLYIIGRSLSETHSPSPQAITLLEKSQVIIGESRRVTDRFLSRIALKKDCQIFLLDNQPPKEQLEMKKALEKLVDTQGTAVLFSDMGMPLLFDPGHDVLEHAKKLQLTIRSIPGPTSWGTACALSGWSPPFFVQGFLSAKTEIRAKELERLHNSPGHLVLMDTPYRFLSLIKDVQKVFGNKQDSFLAWEIGTAEEIYFWGNLKELEDFSEKQSLKKGEFILILKKPV